MTSIAYTPQATAGTPDLALPVIANNTSFTVTGITDFDKLFDINSRIKVAAATAAAAGNPLPTNPIGIEITKTPAVPPATAATFEFKFTNNSGNAIGGNGVNIGGKPKSAKKRAARK
jgi:hypothetical protein